MLQSWRHGWLVSPTNIHYASQQWSKLAPRIRHFSSSRPRRLIEPLQNLPPRIKPQYIPGPDKTLLSLRWPTPPRNILITRKQGSPTIMNLLAEFALYLGHTYPDINIILDPESASAVHEKLPFPVYSYVEPACATSTPDHLADKTDVICTLGGDGTILRASSLFSHSTSVPPILSFTMGTIGFLGEWKFKEYKRAFREVYISGASTNHPNLLSELPPLYPLPAPRPPFPPSERSSEFSDGGEYAFAYKNPMGSPREGPSTRDAARILVRKRLRVGVFGPKGERINATEEEGDTYALNEVIVHRGSSPHLKHVDVFVNGCYFTEAVADGMIISSPTGSTAYSLSSGGSIVHPLVPSLLLTPICPRSLSFRPLVLSDEAPITLRLGEKNRGKEVEVSIDGIRLPEGIGMGMEVRVVGEEIRDEEGEWVGGVPTVVRGIPGTEDCEEDHWVGGLNTLLKFNYPWGDEDPGSRW